MSLGLEPEPMGKIHSMSDSLHESICQNKETLKRKLMLRRTVNELQDQGIYPAGKTPVLFAKQSKQLERAKTGDLLKQKIKARPERIFLVQQNILEDTTVDPSLQACQKQLKRARLYDALETQIASRPGLRELVQKNILPSEQSIHEAVDFNLRNNSASSDLSESGSPLERSRPTSFASGPATVVLDQTGGLSVAYAPVVSLSLPSASIIALPEETRGAANSLSSSSNNIAALSSISPSNTVSIPSPPDITPLLTQSTYVKKAKKVKSSKNSSTVSKIIKFHEYKGPPPRASKSSNAIRSSTSPYQITIQQQQPLQSIFVQQTVEQPTSVTDVLSSPESISSPTFCTISQSVPVLKQHPSSFNSSTSPPRTLEDLKVPELRAELKKRGIPVSGLKPQLIEKLRAYAEEILFSKAAASFDVPSSVDYPSPSMLKVEGDDNSMMAIGSPPISPTCLLTTAHSAIQPMVVDNNSRPATPMDVDVKIPVTMQEERESQKKSVEVEASKLFSQMIGHAGQQVTLEDVLDMYTNFSDKSECESNRSCVTEGQKTKTNTLKTSFSLPVLSSHQTSHDDRIGSPRLSFPSKSQEKIGSPKVHMPSVNSQEMIGSPMVASVNFCNQLSSSAFPVSVAAPMNSLMLAATPAVTTASATSVAIGAHGTSFVAKPYRPSPRSQKTRPNDVVEKSDSDQVNGSCTINRSDKAATVQYIQEILRNQKTNDQSSSALPSQQSKNHDAPGLANAAPTFHIPSAAVEHSAVPSLPTVDSSQLALIISTLQRQHQQQVQQQELQQKQQQQSSGLMGSEILQQTVKQQPGKNVEHLLQKQQQIIEELKRKLVLYQVHVQLQQLQADAQAQQISRMKVREESLRIQSQQQASHAKLNEILKMKQPPTPVDSSSKNSELDDILDILSRDFPKTPNVLPIKTLNVADGSDVVSLASVSSPPPSIASQFSAMDWTNSLEFCDNKYPSDVADLLDTLLPTSSPVTGTSTAHTENGSQFGCSPDLFDLFGLDDTDLYSATT